MKLTKTTWIRAGRWVGMFLIGLGWAWVACAQTISTTTVQGTVYLANGAPGSGTLLLSWPAFTTAGGDAVAAGRTSATIGTDGFVSVNLAPNLGSSPAGLFYTAVYNMSNGTTSTEYRRLHAAELLGVFGGVIYQPASVMREALRQARKIRSPADADDE